MPKRKAKSNPSRKRRGKRSAGEFVREEMHALRHGSKHVHTIKQAIAAGLSRARAAGVRIPLPNPSEMFNVSVTYDVVTPESAEQGDFEESGFEHEPEDLTLRDTVALLHRYAPFEDKPYVHSTREGASVSLYQSDSDVDYRTGAETRYAVHVRSSKHNIDRLLRFL